MYVPAGGRILHRHGREAIEQHWQRALPEARRTYGPWRTGGGMSGYLRAVLYVRRGRRPVPPFNTCCVDVRILLVGEYVRGYTYSLQQRVRALRLCYLQFFFSFTGGCILKKSDKKNTGPVGWIGRVPRVARQNQQMEKGKRAMGVRVIKTEHCNSF